jgi:hypothetical protein
MHSIRSPLVVADDDSALRLSIVGGHEVVNVLLSLDIKVDANQRVAHFIKGTCDIIIEVETL